MSNEAKAYLYAGITVIFWSTVATAFKLSLMYLDVFQLVLYASIAAAVVLLVPVVMSGHLNLLISQIKRYPFHTLGYGLLNPMAYYLVLFAAYDLLPAQVAQPVNYTWALVLIFLSVLFLGQRPTRYDVIAACIGYTGVVIIAAAGGDNPGIFNISLPGLGLAILSTFIWASYWILTMNDPRDERVSMCLNFVCVIPVALLACWMFSSFAVPLEGLLGAGYIGVFEMGLAFLFWSRALRLASNTSRVSTLIFLSPFVSLLLIHSILGESIHPGTYVGLIVIVLGLLVQRIPAMWPEQKINRV